MRTRPLARFRLAGMCCVLVIALWSPAVASPTGALDALLDFARALEKRDDRRAIDKGLLILHGNPAQYGLSRQDLIDLRITLSDLYARRSDWTQAADMLERAIEEMNRRPKDRRKPIDHARALLRLADYRFNGADTAGAIGATRRAEQAFRSVFGLDSPDIIPYLNHIITLYRRTGVVERAMILSERLAYLERHADALRAAGPERSGRRKDKVDVFYGTTRVLEGRDCYFGACYGEETSGRLALGTLTVSVPDTHTFANLERPDWYAFEFTPDPDKHVIMTGVTPVPKGRFELLIGEKMAASKRREAFLFVHGYNTSFEGAAIRTAQMAYDLEIDGAAFMFSWPSRHSILSYMSDRNAATSHDTWKRFADYLHIVLERSGARRVYVLAHSIGAEVLMGGFNDYIATRRIAGDDPQPKATEMLFAAPDVDRSSFKAFIKEARPWVSRMTLYSSQDDRALWVSGKIQGQRAGSAPPPLLDQAVETIDITRLTISDFMRHNYYHVEALTDVLGQYWCSLPPANRCSLRQQATGDGQTYWTYDRGTSCNADAFADALVILRRKGLEKSRSYVRTGAFPIDIIDQMKSDLPGQPRPMARHLERIIQHLSHIIPACRVRY